MSIFPTLPTSDCTCRETARRLRPSPRAGEFRYADATIDQARDRLICVREDHTVAGREAVNTLVSLRLDGNETSGEVLVSGNDFYSSPRLSPDGSRLAWLTWNHPNMPWDGCELWVGQLGADGRVAKSECVAGGPEESIFQPEWSPDGKLCFVSDRSGWWNLYLLNVAETDGNAVALGEMQAEFGMPQWVFGMSTYAFESAERMVCSYIQNGLSRLAFIDTGTRNFEPIDCFYADLKYLRAGAGFAVMRAGSATEAASIVRLDVATRTSRGIASFQQSGNRCRLSLNTAGGRVSHRGWHDRARILLPGAKSRLCRPARRAAAAVGPKPWWAHVRRGHGLESQYSILDQPRHRSARRELWRQHRLWRGLTASV